MIQNDDSVLYSIIIKIIGWGMQRGPSQSDSRCQHHDFRLCPLADSLYNAQYYNVSFCNCKSPIKEKGKRMGKKIGKNLTFPRFNQDRNFSTPAFILNAEKSYYESEGPRMRIDHERKMQDYNEEKAEINIPKPRSKNNYCSVCKGSYEDYLQHIVSDNHRRKIHHSSFNRDILELGTRFQGEQIKLRDIPSLEKNLSTRIEDSDEVEIISHPHKMRKRNQEGFLQLPSPAHQQTALPQPQHYPTHMPVSVGMNMGNSMLQTQPTTFKPFSATYQQQMSQFILNLNIFLNPDPFGVNMMPAPPFGMGMGVGGPFLPIQATFHARQQLSALQYSLFNQISACNQMQQMNLQLQAQQPFSSLHTASPSPTTISRTSPPLSQIAPPCIIIQQ